MNSHTSYDEDWVQKEVQALYKTAIDDKGILYIKELFVPKNYSYATTLIWQKEFASNNIISESFNKLYELLESRVAKGAITKDFDSSFTKFHLINNFGWRDKSETMLTGQMTIDNQIDEAAKKAEDAGQ